MKNIYVCIATFSVVILLACACGPCPACPVCPTGTPCPSTSCGCDVEYKFEPYKLGYQILPGSGSFDQEFTQYPPITAAPYTTTQGNLIQNGTATIDDQGKAGGSGQDVNLESVNLVFDFTKEHSITQVRFDFGSYDGEFSMDIDGTPVPAVADIFSLDGISVNNVQISVQHIGQNTGIMELNGTLWTGRLTIGGIRLWVDNVCFKFAAP